MNKVFLMTGAALLALCGAGSAFADDAATGAPVDTSSMVEELIVLGQGQTRQVQTVKADDIVRFAPGTSPLKVISKLPSVNFQSADPYGSYEWSTRITVRGFNQNQLGFTLDGVPLGDMSYGNYNGLHISRAISSENIGRAELAQGVGSLSAPSSSNLGGTLQFTSVDPSSEMGALASATYGSDNAVHAFLRLETGELPTGGRAYLSYGYQNADKWKGEGVQKQQQFNAKFVQPAGPVTLTGFVNYSDRRENDYQDLSIDLVNRTGYDWDNISNDWATAVAIANIYRANPGGDCPQVGGGDGTNIYPAPVECVDDTYFNASGLRKDTLGGLRADWDVTDSLKISLNGYGHHNEGQGLWYTPYVGTPGGAPISIRTTEYEIDRQGLTGSATYLIGAHKVEGGFWLEDNDFHQARRFYGLDATGMNRSSTEFQSDPFFTQWEWKFNTKTYQFYLQDTWQVNEALKVNFGFKSLDVKIESTPVAGTAYAANIESKKTFLPQIGANFRIDERNEVFADYTKNMRAFVGAATSGPFSTSLVGFDAIKDSLEPETSDTFEAGYRYRDGRFQGVLAGYYVQFKDRLLGIAQCPGIVGCFSALANVGGVTSMGLEAVGTFRVTDDWSLFGSYAYNDSTYDDDVVTASGTVNTSGKTTMDSPKHLANASIRYDDGSLFGEFGVSYMSERFYTYTNDASVPGRAIADLSIGYRFQGGMLLDGLEIQGNVTNLFGKDYFSTIGSNGFANSDPAGAFQTLLAGAPRQYFVTVRKQF